MNKSLQNLTVLTAAVAAASLLPQAALAQASGADEVIEEIVTVGTRSAKPRSASDSPVPIDVIDADDFMAMGNTADLTDNPGRWCHPSQQHRRPETVVHSYGPHLCVALHPIRRSF